MPYLNVKPFSTLICACALAMLQACSNAPTVVYKDRIVRVPQPVSAPIEPRLVTDTEPRYEPPRSGPLPLKAVLDRLAATEDALHQCRSQLTELRNVE